MKRTLCSIIALMLILLCCCSCAVTEESKPEPTETPYSSYDYSSGSSSYFSGKSSSYSSKGPWHSSNVRDDGTGNGPYYCYGKNNTCNNKTYHYQDLYCDSCDPDGDNIEG